MMVLGIIGVVLLQLAGAHAPSIDRSAMVDIEGALYQRGTSENLPVGRYGDGWYINEQPKHEVSLSAYSMDRNEVTLAQYALFLTWSCGEVCFDDRMDIDRVSNGYRASPGFADHPVSWVGWAHAHWYCQWMGKRLPTEAEWEFAASGLGGRPWPWDREGGPDCTSTPYSFDGGRCHQSTVGIQATQSSSTDGGLSGMGGNVAEWVSDWYGPYSSEAMTNPTGPQSGSLRVVRGGGFMSNRLEMKPQARRQAHPETRSVDIGFRCAWKSDLTDPPALIRGDLAAADGEMISPRPRLETPSKSQILMDGLNTPTVLMVHDNVLFVAHTEGVTMRDNDGIERLEPNPRIHQWLTDGAQVFGVDQAIEGLWRFVGLEAEIMHDTPGIVLAAASNDAIVWTDGQNIFEVEPDDTNPIRVADRTDINALTLIGDEIWWTEKEGPRLMSLGPDDEEPQERFGPPDIRSPLVLTVGSATEDDILPLSLGLETWPYSGLLCRFNAMNGRVGCSHHGPPKAFGVSLNAGAFVWGTHYGIVSAQAGAPYSFVSDPVLPGGFFLENEELWISDRRAGRVLKTILNAAEED